MSKRKASLRLTAIAVVSGLLIAVGIFRLLSSSRTLQAQPQRQVVAAGEPLSAGTILTARHLVTRNAEEVSGGDFSQVQSVVGRVTAVALETGAPIEESKLAPAGLASGLRARIRPGHRAVALSASLSNGADRLILPGDKVDVVATVEKQPGIPSSKVILQSIEVLTVPEEQRGDGSSSSSNPQSVVVLSVTPAEAEKLALASRIGTIQLLLRKEDDIDAAHTTGITEDTLLPASVSAYRAVEVISGQKRQIQRFGHQGIAHTSDLTPDASAVTMEQ